MTTDKGFKRAVRARAAKTGESYTTARMQMTKGAIGAPAAARPRHLGGANPECNALRNALQRVGLPLSEGMVLGAGGGLGAGYLAITHGMTGFMIGARALWWDSPGFVRAACQRLGVGLAVKETSSAKVAVKNVADALAAGVPPIVWLDKACLPYSLMPREWKKGGYHAALVYELDEGGDRALLGDVDGEPIAVTASELAEARKSITSYKHRTAVVAAPAKAPDLAAVALDGLRACARGLVEGLSRMCMLEGFRAFGEAVSATKGKKAWATLFPPGPHLFRALTSTWTFVERWSGPALLRPLFAEFVDEAQRLTGRKALAGVGALYRECAQRWHEVAQAALPDAVPELRALRQRRERRERETIVREPFPLDAAGRRDLLAGLGRAILAAHQAEVEAQAALAGSV